MWQAQKTFKYLGSYSQRKLKSIFIFNYVGLFCSRNIFKFPSTENNDKKWIELKYDSKKFKE